MEVVYEAGTRDPSEIRQFVLGVLDELRDGGEALQQARDSGLDVEALVSEPVNRDQITIKAGKSGIDPISTTIIIAIARPIVLDLWRKVLLPRIEARWGATAVGREVKPARKPSKK
jgi:hypothetical protein